jgi:hypothetical protein
LSALVFQASIATTQPLLIHCLPLRADGALIVTTPQDVAIIDVRKEVSFCKTTGLAILGVVENMSGLQTPVRSLTFRSHDGTDVSSEVLKHLPEELRASVACCDVFAASKGGAEAMASDMGIPFLGRVPLDPELSRVAEAGGSLQELKHTTSLPAFNGIVDSALPVLPCNMVTSHCPVFRNVARAAQRACPCARCAWRRLLKPIVWYDRPNALLIHGGGCSAVGRWVVRFATIGFVWICVLAFLKVCCWREHLAVPNFKFNVVLQRVVPMCSTYLALHRLCSSGYPLVAAS